jgi:hypothetical protein
MAEIDFTKGVWGHTIHGSTFASAKAPNLTAWIKDKLDGAYRGSAMCHSQKQPKVGDFVSWESQNSVIRAPVYMVKDCRDPRDMHTIFLRVTDDCRTPK